MTEGDHERGELNLGCEELLLDLRAVVPQLSIQEMLQSRPPAGARLPEDWTGLDETNSNQI